MLTHEQLEMRKTGISATEISAVVGLNPWVDRTLLYNRKVGLAGEERQNRAMNAGQRLEDAIVQWYVDASGANVEGDGKETIRSVTIPWALATPDRFVLDGNGIRSKLLEIKTAGLLYACEWGTDPDEIPLIYIVQTNWQMGVTGIHECDVAVLLGGQDFRVFPQHFDQDLFDRLVSAGETFWFRNVIGRAPPRIPSQGRWRRMDTVKAIVDDALGRYV